MIKESDVVEILKEYTFKMKCGDVRLKYGGSHESMFGSIAKAIIDKIEEEHIQSSIDKANRIEDEAEALNIIFDTED
jgi:hypothetical protein